MGGCWKGFVEGEAYGLDRDIGAAGTFEERAGFLSQSV